LGALRLIYAKLMSRGSTKLNDTCAIASWKIISEGGCDADCHQNTLAWPPEKAFDHD